MRILKIIFLCGLLFSAFPSQQNWSGNVSSLTVNANDTLNVTGNVTLDADITCKAIFFPSGQTYTMGKSGTRTISLSGNGLFWKDSSSGSKTYPDSFYISGSGSMRFNGGAVTSTTTKWNFVGNDSLYNAVTLAGATWIIGPSAYCYVNGSTTITITASGYALVIGANGTLNAVAGGFNLRKNASGDFYSLGSGATITGASTSTWTILGNDTKVNFPALTWGMGAVTIRGAGLADTGTFAGVCDFGSAALNLQGISATVQITFLFGSANVTCGTFRYGQSTAALTTGWYNINLGSGTLTCSSFGNAADSISGANVNFNGMVCKVSGNILIPKNMTVTNGTETFITTATSSVTSNGNSVYNFIDSIGNLTLSDAQKFKGNANFKSSGTLSITSGITMDGNNKTLTFANGLGSVTSSSAPIVWNGSGGVLADNKGVTLASWTNGASAGCSFNGSAATTIANGSTSVVLGTGTNLQNSFVLNNSNFDCQNSTLKSYGAFTIGAQTFNAGSSTVYFYGPTNTTVTANGNRFYNRVDSMNNGKKVTLADNQYHVAQAIKNGSFDFNGKADTVTDDFSITNAAGDTVSAMNTGSKLVLTKNNTVNLTLTGTGRKRLDSLEVYINKSINISSDSNFAIKKIVPANHGGAKYVFPCNKQVSLFKPIDYDFSGTSILDTLTSTEACSLATILLVNSDKTDSSLYIKNIQVLGNTWKCTTNCVDGGGNSGIYFGAAPIIDTIPNLTSVNLSYGRKGGGDTRIIYGTDMTAIDSVKIGAAKATITNKTDNSVTITTASSATSGIFNIYSFSRYGYFDTLVNAFTYDVIHGLAISPNSQKDTLAGTSIAITASYGLTGTSLVSGGPLGSYTVLTDTTASASSLAKAKGNYPVQVYVSTDSSNIVYYRYGATKKLARGGFGFYWTGFRN